MFSLYDPFEHLCIYLLKLQRSASLMWGKRILSFYILKSATCIVLTNLSTQRKLSATTYVFDRVLKCLAQSHPSLMHIFTCQC